jgi:hypothetical protein
MTTTIEDVPLDVLARIIEYVHVNMYWNNFMMVRRVNKRFNAAAKLSRLPWIDLICKHGPKKIGNSRHFGAMIAGKCKLNKAGKCHIAGHYMLEPKIDLDGEFPAYTTAMRIVLAKRLTRAERELATFGRKLEEAKGHVIYYSNLVFSSESRVERIHDEALRFALPEKPKKKRQKTK